MGQLSASAAFILQTQPQAHDDSAKPRRNLPRPLQLSDPGEPGVSGERTSAAATASQPARRSLAQTLRTLSDDEEYAAGAGCLWDSSASDRSSDDGLLALAGVSTQGLASAASSESPARCDACSLPLPGDWPDAHEHVSTLSCYPSPDVDFGPGKARWVTVASDMRTGTQELLVAKTRLCFG